MKKPTNRKTASPVPNPPAKGLVPVGRTLAGTTITPLEVFQVPAVHPSGDGPWAAEPDKVSWIDPATELPCIMRRGTSGELCGYVGVGSDHPMYGMAADALPHDPAILAHGGITYAEPCEEREPPEVSVCHVPQVVHARYAPLATDFDASGWRPEIKMPHDLWWFGFSCNKSYDFVPSRDAERVKSTETGRTYRDERYVVAETTSLAAQLHAVAHGLPMPGQNGERPPVGLGGYEIGRDR